MKSFEQIEQNIADRKKKQSNSYILSAETNSKYIEFVCVVGFHHSVGAQVEYVYPPLQEDTEERLSGEFIRMLP